MITSRGGMMTHKLLSHALRGKSVGLHAGCVMIAQ